MKTIIRKKMYAQCFSILGIVVLLTMTNASIHGQETGPGEAILQNAEIIFIGTVKSTGVAPNADVKASDKTVIVTVEDMLKPESPSPLAQFTHHDVTVQLKDSPDLLIGNQVTFYTKLWKLGSGLALIEMAHTISETQGTPGAETILEAHRAGEQFLLQQADQDLRNRIAQAEIVVMGRVKAIREVQQSEALATIPDSQILSEHNPNWREAMIEVEEGIKGFNTTTTREITVLFPGSDDVMWKGAPKFEIGEEGIFILKKEDMTAENAMFFPSSQTTKRTIIDQRDFLPKDQIDHIKELISP